MRPGLGVEALVAAAQQPDFEASQREQEGTESVLGLATPLGAKFLSAARECSRPGLGGFEGERLPHCRCD